MIINRHAHVGLFEKKKDINEQGLFIFDFVTSKKTYLNEYADWEPCCVSTDGKRFAIKTTCSNRGAYRTNVTVIDQNEILYTTKDYYVYDIAFNVTGEKLLMVAEKKKPFCYNLSTQEIIAHLPKQIRLYKGDLDRRRDIFFAPCEKTKDTCYLFSFETGMTETIKMGTQALISRVKIDNDLEKIYLITETNILYCLDRTYKVIWKKDFNYLGLAGGRIHPSDIFISEDGKLLCVYSSASETNKWGTDYVVDSLSGEIINQIENYQFRGRLMDNYFGNKVLTYKLTTLDMLTGEISDSGLI